MSNNTITQDLLIKIRGKQATLDDLIFWFTHVDWGGGPIFIANIRNFLLPVLEDLKQFQPGLRKNISFDLATQDITITDSRGKGRPKLYTVQPGAVIAPDLATRINDLIHGAAGAAAGAAESIFKWWWRSETRVIEGVVGVLLIAVGINAMLKGRPTDTAKKAVQFTPVGRVARTERRVAARGQRTTARVAERERIQSAGTAQRAEIRRQASYRAAYAKEAGKGAARENAAVIRAARNARDSS